MELLILLSPVCMCLSFVLFAALIIGGIFWIKRRVEAPRAEAWRDLAARTRMTFTPGTFFEHPSVAGTFRGRSVRVGRVTRGVPGRNLHSYTVITLAVDNPKEVYLSLSGEGLLSGIAKSVGMQDIQINDEEFDRRFVIKSQPEAFARELFAQGGLRRHLLQARSLNVILQGRQLTFEQIYTETDVSYLLFLLDLLCHLAEACERPAGAQMAGT